jgi:hypothetical protein
MYSKTLNLKDKKLLPASVRFFEFSLSDFTMLDPLLNFKPEA